jgi:hypothetical protein
MLLSVLQIGLMTYNEKYLVVSIINSIIEEYCNKSNFCLDENPVNTYGIGVTSNGEILSVNGDNLEDTLEWVLNEITPKLKIK